VNVSAVGKFLDQPILISKLKNQTPKILTGTALAYGIYDTMKAPKEERRNKGIKNAVVLSTVIIASLVSAFGLKTGKKQIIKGLVDVKEPESIIKRNINAVNKFSKSNTLDKKAENTLNKAKTGF